MLQFWNHRIDIREGQTALSAALLNVPYSRHLQAFWVPDMDRVPSNSSLRAFSCECGCFELSRNTTEWDWQHFLPSAELLFDDVGSCGCGNSPHETKISTCLYLASSGRDIRAASSPSSFRKRCFQRNENEQFTGFNPSPSQIYGPRGCPSQRHFMACICHCRRGTNNVSKGTYYWCVWVSVDNMALSQCDKCLEGAWEDLGSSSRGRVISTMDRICLWVGWRLDVHIVT